MARNLYFDTSAKDPRNSQVVSNTNTLPIGAREVFTRGDNNPTNLYLVDSIAGGYFSDSGAASVTPKLALVTPGAVPTGGTFKVEFSATASASIAYNASAAAVQSALNGIAAVASAGNVTVTGLSPCWLITWDTTGAKADFTENENLLTPDGSIGISKITDGDGSNAEVIALEIKRQPHTIQTTWSQITNGWSADFAMVDQKLCDLLNGAASVNTTLELEVTDASGKVRTYAQVPCVLLSDGINTGIISNQSGSTYYTATESDNLFAKRAQNLSDLASAATARTNLGIDASTTPYTPTTGGDWSTSPTEVEAALDELAARGGAAAILKTESAEVAVSSSGDTDLNPDDTKAISSFFVSATAGAGTYTRNLLLKQPTPGETAQVALIRLSLSATSNSTVNVYDDTTGGTLIYTTSGNAKRARQEIVVCVWNNDSTQWELMNEPGGSGVGLQSLWIPASAITPRGTNGASVGSTETSVNKVMLSTLDFDQSTAEYGQFDIAFPKGWNAGTVFAQFIWTAASGSGDVIWGIQGISIVNDGALDVAFGTAQTVTDTVLATNDSHHSPETSAITISGAAANAVCHFQVYRDAADGSDTLAADAKLIGIKLLYSVTQSHDD